MKKNSLFKMARFAWVLIMALAIVTTSCKKDDDDEDPDGGTTTPVEDGMYIKGAGTGLADFDIKGLMTIAKNEVNQEDRADLYELYIAVKAGTDGFNIVTVDGSTQTTYGPGADFAEVTELDGEEPTLGLWRGAIAETETPFTVPEDGLYHVVYDTEIGIVTVSRVVWGVIGAATPGGWSTSTQLNTTFDLNEMVFEGTNIEMAKNEFKFRYSNGWKVILDADYVVSDGVTGIKVNTNYGGSIDALVAGGGNITPDASGLYTIKVTWSLENGTSAELTKTGDLQVTDWTNVMFDVFGNGVDSTATTAVADQSSWAWGYAVTSDNDGTPEIDGEVSDGATFTYTWTAVSLIPFDEQGFAFRSFDGTDYNGTVHRYAVIDSVNSDFSVIGNTTNGFGDVNFNVLEAGLYDVTLSIDAADEDKASVIIVKNGATTPELYMLGDGCAAGWNADAPIAMNGTDGLYTITADLIGGGEGIKFISVIGQWQPQYGMGDSPGVLAVNDGTGTDPNAIPVDADGTYDITVNTNDMTYSVVAAVTGPVLYVPGSYQGWDPAGAPTIVDADEDGVYEGVVEITDAGDNLTFKFTANPNWDGPNYGAGDTDGSLSIDPSAGDLEVPAAGSYLFTVDTNNLTWTYVLQ